MGTGDAKQICHALWVGPSLPPLARGCLRSFVRVGQKVVLHCYNEVADVPQGVELADAARVLPESAIFRHHRSGSLAIFSDYFRLKLMETQPGYWIDCDVYCVRPLDFEENPIFGWQDETIVNSAVLRLLPNSPLHRDFLALIEDPSAKFPWIKRRKLMRARIKSMLYGKPKAAFLPWGAVGPDGLTALLQRHEQLDLAQPRDVFYPLPHLEADRLGDPAFDLQSVVTPATRCIHLWNDMLRQFKTEPRPGSFLDRLNREAEGGQAALAV